MGNQIPTETSKKIESFEKDTIKDDNPIDPVSLEVTDPIPEKKEQTDYRLQIAENTRPIPNHQYDKVIIECMKYHDNICQNAVFNGMDDFASTIEYILFHNVTEESIDSFWNFLQDIIKLIGIDESTGIEEFKDEIKDILNKVNQAKKYELQLCKKYNHIKKYKNFGAFGILGLCSDCYHFKSMHPTCKKFKCSLQAHFINKTCDNCGLEGYCHKACDHFEKFSETRNFCKNCHLDQNQHVSKEHLTGSKEQSSNTIAS
ncbi:MAG: hypothetical protein Dasosvirus4_17 [Dasosvirus sp.]|uniref:Uncharacterized protein n=1 Tax=Dasosvirus sp. TaxID=2487764 RepID=A0A3G4ZRG0_9VIRU|nr:MAG: hypothetical protein Dasosvirus4_17 [Dasosvirus sp.]